MTVRHSLFRKYTVYSIALVSAALIMSGLVDLYFTFQQSKPMSASLERTGLLLLVGGVLAVAATDYIAVRIVKPIQAIVAAAAQLAAGKRVEPIAVRTGDELEALADQFNRVAERFNATYAGVEQKADERTIDLTETLEQQTATSEIMRVITSSPTDPKPVFDALLEYATRLCGAEVAAVGLYNGETYEHVHQRGVGVEQASWLFRGPFRPSAQSGLGRMIAEAQPIQIVDGSESTIFGAGLQDAAGEGAGRTRLWVPLLKEGRVIGALSLYRFKPGAFTQRQVEVVSTFANQAAIAIENARVFRQLQQRNAELTESLEQQTATSEVLKMISRTAFDLKPVLETLVENAVVLCGANQGVLFRLDGDLYKLEIAYNTPPEYVVWRRENPIRAGRESVTGRAVLEKRSIQVDDVLSDTEYRGPTPQLLGGQRTVLAVPLLREDVPIGVIAIFRAIVQPFTDKQVELVTTFADQAAIAIENVRLFNEIQTKSRELEVANRHKMDFLASMSHELRTPLNAIIGFSEVLQERMFGEINEKQAEYLQDIHGSGMHLLSLINDILDLSKIDAGRMDLELSRFDLVAALNNTLTLVRERATRNNVTLDLDFDSELGDWTADERKFKQIMLNLLSNAVKFTPAGGKIGVRARRGDGCVVIAVTDTGVGIRPEDQDLVFEEFRQAGRDNLKKSEGTGLGLALTKRFVELHKGRIGVKSEVGKGSTFTFTLPENISESAASEALFSDVLLASLRQHLTRYIGPVARLVVARAAKRALDIGELTGALAEAIPQQSERQRFIKDISAAVAARPDSMREAMQTATPVLAMAEPASTRAPAPVAAIGARLPALERLLAIYIGPMAKIFIANAVKRAHSDEELINCLAEGIDSERDRSAFLTRAVDVMSALRRSQA
jgi:signal transduction histidine kinase